MQDIVDSAMEIMYIELPVEGINIPLFALVAGMAIIYLILKIIFQRKGE